MVGIKTGDNSRLAKTQVEFLDEALWVVSIAKCEKV